LPNHVRLIKPVRREPLRAALLQLWHAAPAHASVSIKKNAIEHGPTLHVLVAKDNLMNHRLMARFIEKRGHTVTLAQDGQEAVDLVQQHAFDVVLMDMRMPSMDGVETARKIRSLEPPERHVAILALAANAFEEHRHVCLLRAEIERVKSTSSSALTPAGPVTVPEQRG
jgi:CheY-like chemotaxis protein